MYRLTCVTYSKVWHTLTPELTYY
eukprot:SAG11_NODE_12519_length_699_cov_0.983333_1_plen_23_part_01